MAYGFLSGVFRTVADKNQVFLCANGGQQCLYPGLLLRRYSHGGAEGKKKKEGQGEHSAKMVTARVRFHKIRILRLNKHGLREKRYDVLPVLSNSIRTKTPQPNKQTLQNESELEGAAFYNVATQEV